MRYQVVVLGSEIADAMTIESLTFNASPGTGEYSSFQQYYVYMGPTTRSSLGTSFDENYSGPRIKVFDHSNVTHYNTDGVVTITLDTPYFYSGQNNLLIEINYFGGDIEPNSSVYSMYCSVDTDRVLRAYSFEATTGMTERALPHLVMTGTMDLDACTFGGIKASFQ